MFRLCLCCLFVKLNGIANSNQKKSRLETTVINEKRNHLQAVSQWFFGCARSGFAEPKWVSNDWNAFSRLVFGQKKKSLPTYLPSLTRFHVRLPSFRKSNAKQWQCLPTSTKLDCAGISFIRFHCGPSL